MKMDYICNVLKKTSIFLCLLFVVLSAAVQGQLRHFSEYDFTQNYLKKNHIKGHVKKMNEIHVSIERSPNAWGYLYSYHEFDQKGNLIKISQFDVDFGEITAEVSFIYNQQHLLVESRNYPFKYILDSIYLDTTAMTRDTFIYNNKKLLVAIHKYKHSKIKDSVQLKYNSEGKITEELNSALAKKTTWNYDKANVIIEEVYTGNSKLPNIVNTYNRKGKIILHQERNNASTPSTFDRIDSFQYENHEKKVTDASYTNGLLNWKNISYYNKDMQIIKVQFYNSDNKFTDEINYTFDKDNHVIMATGTENNLNSKVLESTKFTNIDKRGNWVNATVGSSPGYTIKRSIEYYK